MTPAEAVAVAGMRNFDLWKICRRNERGDYDETPEHIRERALDVLADAYDAALQRADTAERERDAERNEAADCRLYLRTCVDVLRAHGMDGTPWYDGLKRMAKMDALDAEDHI